MRLVGHTLLRIGIMFTVFLKCVSKFSCSCISLSLNWSLVLIFIVFEICCYVSLYHLVNLPFRSLLFHDFVAKCLTKDPRSRPAASEMLKVMHSNYVCQSRWGHVPLANTIHIYSIIGIFFFWWGVRKLVLIHLLRSTYCSFGNESHMCISIKNLFRQ